jgi:hypothetical protein
LLPVVSPPPALFVVFTFIAIVNREESPWPLHEVRPVHARRAGER